MILPEFEYVVPESLQEACTLLGQHGPRAMVLAGGTDLLVKMKFGRAKPSCVVSLRRLVELKGIRYEPGVGVVMGARATLNEMLASPVLRERYPSVCSAAGTMAGYQIRAIGTLGGNLGNAVPFTESHYTT